MRADNQLVIIDASPSGVSGDKYLGALIDLGGNLGTLRKTAKVVSENLPGAGHIGVSVKSVERGEIGSRLVTVESRTKPRTRKGAEILRSAEKSAAKLGLSEWGTKFAQSTVQTLLRAESKVHAHKPRDVELHELGSPDTLVDILGVACLIESLGLDDATWWSSPVAVGGGTTRFSNRAYPNPPPAVAEILRENHFAIERGLADTELSTPTGVAITVNLVSKQSGTYPNFKPEKVGYGAGSKELSEIANVLRLTVGQSLDSSHLHDEMTILETNLDDVSGEIIGRAAETLMASGARDVTITPVFMKKNRPGYVISVIATGADAEKLAGVMMRETGTLGVRELPVSRHISPRKSTEITVKIGRRDHRIRVKLSQDRRGRTVRAKPEYEDLKKISDDTGLSLRELQKTVQRTIDSTEE